MRQVYVYTDGSCDNHTKKKGGYGVVIVDEEKVYKIHGGRYDQTTSQRMELMAVIAALKKVKQLDCIATIFIDSKYIVDAVNQGWLFRWIKDDFKGKKNEGLWKVFLEQYDSFNRGDIVLKWVKGHNGNEYNEIADDLARKGSNKEKIIIDNFG